MNQKILITIDLGGSVYKRYSTEDLEYPASAPIFYEGRVIDAGGLDRSLTDFFYGAAEISDVSFTLDNTDGVIRELRDAYELRGCFVTIKRVDTDTETELDSITVTITGVDITLINAVFTTSQQDLAIWDTIIPKKKISEDIFGNRIARYCFESGALTVDSISDNTLTAVGSPTADSDCKEGSSSCYFDGSSYFYRIETLITGSFIIKCWILPKTGGSSFLPIALQREALNSGNYTFVLNIGKFTAPYGAATFTVYNTSQTPAFAYTSTSSIIIDNNHWYYINARYDVNTGIVSLEVWDDTMQKFISATSSHLLGSLYSTAGMYFGIGYKSSSHLMGNIDDFILSLPFGTIPEESLGMPISTWFGLINKVPCWCIQEDTDNDYYDFLIGYGVLHGVTQVYRTENGTTVDVPPEEYTFFDGSQTSPFEGYAFLRFVVEQRDANGNLDIITADIQGLEISGGTLETNPVICFKEWLTNITWGLGLTVDTALFTTAATACNGTGLNIVGGFYEFKTAAEWRDNFLIACRLAQLSKGSNGYEIYVPEYKADAGIEFNEHNMIVKKDYQRSVSDYVKKIKFNYAYSLLTNAYSKVKEVSTGKNFGTEKEYFSLFTYYEVGGIYLAETLRNRFLYQDRFIEYEAGQDAADLSLHDIVNLTYESLGLSTDRFEIVKITKQNLIYILTVAEYNEDIFSAILGET